jgi:hypothetical protein
MFHRVRDREGGERPTASIKGGCIEGLDWSGAKHIYTRTAVVPIPPGAEQWRASPEVMEGRPTLSNMSKEHGQQPVALPAFPEHPFD